MFALDGELARLMRNPFVAWFARLGLGPVPAANRAGAAEAADWPEHLASEVLPGLRVDRQLGSYETRAHWQGVEIDVSIDADEDVAAALHTAHQLWADQGSWQARILARAVADLLLTYNENWQDEEDGADLTADAFAARLTIESISAGADGEFTFYFADGDMFSGHTVFVRGSLLDGPRKANLGG